MRFDVWQNRQRSAAHTRCGALRQAWRASPRLATEHSAGIVFGHSSNAPAEPPRCYAPKPAANCKEVEHENTGTHFWSSDPPDDHPVSVRALDVFADRGLDLLLWWLQLRLGER